MRIYVHQILSSTTRHFFTLRLSRYWSC